MPIYEYKCGTCGEVFELKQKFSDAPLTIHEGCGGPVQRLISAPAIQFKGSGWYITDYAKSGQKASNGGDASAAPKTDKPATSDSSTSSTSPSTSSSAETKK
jgi:putative FmdB family regulatory protein